MKKLNKAIIIAAIATMVAAIPMLVLNIKYNVECYKDFCTYQKLGDYILGRD